MKTPLQRTLWIVTLVVSTFVPVGAAHANAEIFDRVLTSTGLVLAPQGDGKDMVGTCWVIDHERRLVITANHVIAKADKATVIFPMFANGEVVALRDPHLKSAPRIAGEVLHREVSRDLALVRLEKLPTSAKAIPLASKSSRPGETLHTVGNSGYTNGILWRYTRGQVRSVAPYRIQIETGLINTTVIETQGPINKGDSGGPVVNDQGELAGVVSAFHNQDRLISWSIDVREVRTFLANALRAETTVSTGPRR